MKKAIVIIVAIVTVALAISCAAEGMTIDELLLKGASKIKGILVSPSERTLHLIPEADKSDWPAGQNLAEPEVQYSGRGATEYTTSTYKPTAAGSYTATMTVGGQTVTMDFEI